MKRNSTPNTLKSLNIEAIFSHSEDYLSTKKSLPAVTSALKEAIDSLKNISEDDYDNIAEFCHDAMTATKKAKRIKRNETYLEEYTKMFLANMKEGEWYSKNLLASFANSNMAFAKKDTKFDNQCYGHDHIVTVCMDRLIKEGKVITHRVYRYGTIYSLLPTKEDF